MTQERVSPKPIVFTFHARRRMKDRDASEKDVIAAIRTGE